MCNASVFFFVVEQLGVELVLYKGALQRVIPLYGRQFDLAGGGVDAKKEFSIAVTDRS